MSRKDGKGSPGGWCSRKASNDSLANRGGHRVARMSFSPKSHGTTLPIGHLESLAGDSRIHERGGWEHYRSSLSRL